MPDLTHVVAQGYNIIAERYLTWAAGIMDDHREHYTRLIEDRLPPGAAVLDLGCGAGIPTAKRLADRFTVTGVDISARQIELARHHVPNATFMRADMVTVDLPPDSFDVVGAFYALTHVPRDEHTAVVRRIARWLRPGGLFIATFGSDASDGIEDDWLGVPMYFSHHDAATNRRLVTDAGLHILSAEHGTIDEYGVPATFHWIVAERPAG